MAMRMTDAREDVAVWKPCGARIEERTVGPFHRWTTDDEAMALTTDADHDLLMSIFAWRRGLVTREALAAACRGWIGDGPESRSLGDALEARGLLTASTRAQAAAMASRHLAERGAGLGAFEASVAELSQAVGVDLARLCRRLRADQHHQKRDRASGAASRTGPKAGRGLVANSVAPGSRWPLFRIALGAALAVMTAAVLTLVQENRRLEAEVGRLSRDNVQWQWSFRAKVDAVNVRETAVRDGMIALEGENQARREAEEARDRARAQLARVERERDEAEGRAAALAADLERARDDLAATRAAMAGVIAVGPGEDDRRVAYEAALPALNAYLEDAGPGPTSNRAAALVAIGRAGLASARGEEALAALREAMAVSRALGEAVEPDDLLAGAATPASDPDRARLLSLLRDQGFPSDPFAHDEVMLGQVDQSRR
jgi:hypothetical protein